MKHMASLLINSIYCLYIGCHTIHLMIFLGGLQAQSDIVAKVIHSIDLDPSCPYQLAFHLDDGW